MPMIQPAPTISRQPSINPPPPKSLAETWPPSSPSGLPAGGEPGVSPRRGCAVGWLRPPSFPLLSMAPTACVKPHVPIWQVKHQEWGNQTAHKIGQASSLDKYFQLTLQQGPSSLWSWLRNQKPRSRRMGFMWLCCAVCSLAAKKLVLGKGHGGRIIKLVCVCARRGWHSLFLVAI